MPDPAPNPPRFRWLKRLALFCAIALVGLALLRLYWGHREQADLDRLIDIAHDKGYPVYFNELQPPTLAANDNRATHIHAALRLIPYITAQNQHIDDTDWYNEGGAEYADEHQLPDPITDNADYLAQFRPVLDTLRQAQPLTRTDWTYGQPIPRPALDMLLPHLSDCRRLARVIEDAVYRAMDEEDYPLALAMLADLMTLADALRDEPYGLINHLVVISIRAITAYAIQAVLPRLPDDPALAAPLETLNQLWLNEDWAEQGLAKAYQSELWQVYDYVEGVIDGRDSYSRYFGYTPEHLMPLEFGPSRWLMRPYYQSDLAFFVRYYTALIDAADGCKNQQTYDAQLERTGVSAMDRALESAPYLLPLEYPISKEGIWSIAADSRTHFRQLATSRLCAAAIAIKRYTLDHGQPPDTLAQLVPDYLDAVPDDPFVQGRPITYLPAGASPVLETSHGHNNLPLDPEVSRRLALTYPLLYCVANDGIDDGGRFPIRDDSGRIDGWFNSTHDPTDWCFFLTELPKPIPNPNVSPFSPRGPGGGLGPPPGSGNGPVTPSQPGSATPTPQGDNPDDDPDSEASP